MGSEMCIRDSSSTSSGSSSRSSSNFSSSSISSIGRLVVVGMWGIKFDGSPP